MLWTTGTFELSVHIQNVDAPTVYEHLRTNQHWLNHPLIVEWHETAPGEYHIIDTVKMFGLSMRVPYRSKVTVLDAQTIRFEGFQGMVYVDNRTSVLPADDGCTVQEYVTVRTLRGMRGFVMQQAEESHRAMLNGLAQDFQT